MGFLCIRLRGEGLETPDPCTKAAWFLKVGDTHPRVVLGDSAMRRGFPSVLAIGSKCFRFLVTMTWFGGASTQISASPQRWQFLPSKAAPSGVLNRSFNPLIRPMVSLSRADPVRLSNASLTASTSAFEEAVNAWSSHAEGWPHSWSGSRWSQRPSALMDGGTRRTHYAGG